MPVNQPLPVGTVFGAWTITACLGVINRARVYLCRCSCGNEANVTSSALGRHRRPSRSCGKCKHGNFQHGYRLVDKPDLTYTSWQAMLRRCYTPTCANYKYYGARGIYVYLPWHDFPKFLEDVGPRPAKEFTLERKNTEGHYEPGNVCWASITAQNRNKRSNKRITYNGTTQTLIEWAHELNITAPTLSGRLKRGWSLDRAFTTPTMPQFAHRKAK